MSRFSERLASHSPEKVRTAFEAMGGHERCDEFKANSATRSRWLSGQSRPQRREWVEVLAELLQDADLVASWESDAVSHASDRDLKNTLTRIGGLSAEQRRELYEHLRLTIYPSEFSTRDALSLEISLRPLSATLIRGDVTVRWRGDVPANAKVRIAADTAGLDAAFADQSCIYRDLVTLADDELEAAFALTAEEGGDAPLAELSFQPRRSRWTRLEASQGEPGVFEFHNDAIAAASLRLRVRFPFPAKFPVYVVRFGSYAVRGPARISLKLHDGLSSEKPRFLLATQPCEVLEDREGDGVSIELGTEDELLPASPTVFFYWGANAPS